MVQKKHIHNLTQSDRFLIGTFTDFLLGEPDFSDLLIPPIETDCSYLPPLLQSSIWKGCAEGGEQWKSENESAFDTDQMGLYNPDDHSIVLFARAIEAVSQMLGIEEDVLRSLTIIHFLSQFIVQCPADSMHAGWADGVKRLKEKLDSKGVDSWFIMLNFHVASPEYFRKCSNEYIVSAAQIQTYLIVRHNDKYLRAFQKIAAHQSKAYNKFRELKGLDTFELRLTMDLVRNTEYFNQLFPDTTPIYVNALNIDSI